MASANLATNLGLTQTVTISGVPVDIRMGPEFLREIRAEMNNALRNPPEHEKTGGFLLGHRDPAKAAVFVVSCKPCGRDAPAHGTPGSAHAAEELGRGKRPPTAIGFYRISVDQETFDAADVDLIESHFRDRRNVFVVACSARRSLVLHVWRDSRLHRQDHEISVDLLSGIQSAIAPAEASGKKVRGALITPAVAARVDHIRRGVSRPGVLAIGGLALATGTFALLPRPRHTSADTATVSRPAAPVTPDRGIALSASRTGDDWSVTWNGESDALTKARVAILLINDGNAHREVLLDPAQIHSGRVVYAPSSDQVEFRLAVIERDGANATDTVVAVGAAVRRPPAMLSPQSVLESGRSLLLRKPALRQKKTITLPSASRDDVASGEISAATRKIFQAPEPLGLARAELPPAPTVGGLALFPSAPAVLPGALPLPSPPAHSLPESQAVPKTPATAVEQKAPAELPEGGVPVSPARVLRQRPLAFTQSVRSMISNEMTLQVQVQLDANGNVVSAKPVAGAGAKGFVGREAAAAVRQWEFAPARSGGRTVPSEMILVFRLTPDRR